LWVRPPPGAIPQLCCGNLKSKNPNSKEFPNPKNSNGGPCRPARPLKGGKLKAEWEQVRSDSAKRRDPWSIFLLAALFIIGGILHFVMPGKYEGIIPFWIPDHPFIVGLSGIAEILGGVGLLLPLTRTVASWCLIVLLVAVFPANIELLRQAQSAGASEVRQLVLWLRLPVQGVLIWWIGWSTQLRLFRRPHK
jgi:uncharacterized membrane protein